MKALRATLGVTQKKFTEMVALSHGVVSLLEARGVIGEDKSAKLIAYLEELIIEYPDQEAPKNQDQINHHAMAVWILLTIKSMRPPLDENRKRSDPERDNRLMDLQQSLVPKYTGEIIFTKNKG